MPKKEANLFMISMFLVGIKARSFITYYLSPIT